MENMLQQIFNTLLTLRNSAATIDSAEAITFLNFCRMNLTWSNSQIFQDLFVQFELRDKHNGYFVEFGASDGIENSNSLSLERQFGWNGILAEPGKMWHTALCANRSANIELKCVWDQTGETLEFSEVKNAGLGGLSTVRSFSDKDGHAALRENSSVYNVETISLNDLLHKHSAPKTIDYMSVDTEGTELKILTAFDFSAYDVRLISVEHNFTPLRESIHTLLVSKGYRRKFDLYSYVDDWYVKL